MPAKSFALDNAVINYYLRNQAISPTQAATVYVALFTVAPSPSGGGTEVVGNGYARTAVTMGAPVSGVSSNTAQVNFPAATGSWGTVVACAIFDAAAAGNLLYFGNLTTPKTVNNLDTVSFGVGALAVTEQ